MARQLPQLAERLDETLGHADLRADARAWGQALLDRLKSPVQIVVLGPKGAGKSLVIDLLAGVTVVPRAVAAPVVEIVGGAREALKYECMDGATGVTDGAHLPDGVVRLTRSVPLASLEDCSFAEVDLDGPPAALEWALERADIVLWCSPGFDADERAVWADVWAVVPDALKDHCFLVLTHADTHIAQGTLAERLEALSEVVAEEFLGLFAIATPLAINAREQAGGAGSHMWKSSGGKALHDSVHKRIEHGRLADQDSARLFLSRFAGLRQTRATMAAPAETGARAPRNTTRRNVGQTVDRPAAPCRAAPMPTMQPKAQPVSHPVLGAAEGVLQHHADRILAAAGTPAGATPAVVLDQCVEAAGALADLLSDQPADGQSSAPSGLGDDAAECAEMMLLFQLERTEDAAVDAVTLLMQLKREIAEHAFG